MLDIRSMMINSAANIPAVDLRYKPRPWQDICHRTRSRFSVRVLHRRAGKTELGLMELINAALLFNDELGLFVYIAPFLKQAKRIAWRRLVKRLEPLALAGVVEIRGGDDLTVIFKHNGAMIQLFGADNPDGLRGVRLDGAVIDEVAQMKPEVWVEILQPALSDRLGWATFIGTPKGINLFSELFYKAQTAEGQNDGWSAQSFTVYDTGTIDPGEVERLRRDMTTQAFAREFLCDFTAAGDDQIMSLVDVEMAAHRHLALTDYNYAPIVIGVDPARFGDDDSVIFIRQGLKAFPPRHFHGIDNMRLADMVANVYNELHADAIFIDAGNGSGVIDRLRQLSYDVIEIPFGSSPSDAMYLNKRAEMWFGISDWIAAGGSIPNDMDLKRDLAAPTYFFTRGTEKKAMESKEDIKGRGLPSPDRGDALALTFAYPVEKRKRQIEGVRDGSQRVYDPYQDLN